MPFSYRRSHDRFARPEKLVVIGAHAKRDRVLVNRFTVVWYFWISRREIKLQIFYYSPFVERVRLQRCEKTFRPRKRTTTVAGPATHVSCRKRIRNRVLHIIQVDKNIVRLQIHKYLYI